MNLKKLHSRLLEKLPLLAEDLGCTYRPRFRLLAEADPDFRWVYERSFGIRLNEAIRSVSIGRLCSMCKFGLPRTHVCADCLRTKSGQELSKRLSKEASQQTCLIKYGTRFHTQSDSTKKAIKRSNLRRYGVPNQFQRPEILKVILESNLRKYGVSNVSQREDIKAKKEQTTFCHYGVSHNSQSDQIKSQKIRTSLRRFGVRHPTQHPDVQDKRTQTFLAKYGVEHVLQNAEVFCRQQSSARGRKEIRILGQTHSVQGYEPQVLAKLESRGLLDWVVTDPGLMPKILYTDTRYRTRRYFPDAVFESTSGKLYILEVKSAYSILDESVSLKAKAARSFCRESHGLYDYVLALHHKNGTTEWIKSARKLRSVQRKLLGDSIK